MNTTEYQGINLMSRMQKILLIATCFMLCMTLTLLNGCGPTGPTEEERIRAQQEKAMQKLLDRQGKEQQELSDRQATEKESLQSKQNKSKE